MATNENDGTNSRQEHKRIKASNITFEQYRDGCKWYQEMGDRTAKGLAKKFGWSPKLAHQLIDEGIAEYDWKSYKYHAKLYDDHRMTADLIAQQDKYSEMQDLWNKARNDNLKLARASKGAFAVALSKTMEAVQTMKFVNYRRVKTAPTPQFPHGNWELIETPFTARQTCDTLRMVAQALRDVGQFESFWLGGKPEESASTGKGWSKLTPEQLDYISETGQLPPGVSDDALFGVGLESARKN